MQQDHQSPGHLFGCHLRRLRGRASLTRREVAIAAGVTPGMVLRWERRGVIPSVPHLKRLATALGVPPDALLGTSGLDAESRRASEHTPILRALREAAGLSQWQLAIRLGVTEGAVSRWESGDRQPSGRYLATLARLVAGGSVATVLASLPMPLEA